MGTPSRLVNHTSNYFLPLNAFPLYTCPPWIACTYALSLASISVWGIRQMAVLWPRLARSTDARAEAWTMLALWCNDLAWAITREDCTAAAAAALKEASPEVREAMAVWLRGGWHHDRAALREGLWRLGCCSRTVSAASALHRTTEGIDPWDPEGSGTYPAAQSA